MGQVGVSRGFGPGAKRSPLTLVAALVSALLLAACGERGPAALGSDAVGPVVTEARPDPADATADEDSTGDDGLGTDDETTERSDDTPISTGVGGRIGVDSVEDFAEAYNGLAVVGGPTGANRPIDRLSNGRTGNYAATEMTLWPVNPGVSMGVSHGADRVITGHVLVFNVNAPDIDEILDIHLALAIPDADYRSDLDAFIGGTEESVFENAGAHEVFLFRDAGLDPLDPIIVAAILPTDGAAMDHADITLAVADAISQTLDGGLGGDDPTEGDGDEASADREPVSRQRAAERDVTIDECTVTGDAVRIVGRIENRGTITRTYLLRVEVFDPDNERTVPGVFGNTIEPGEVWEFDEGYDLDGDAWSQCRSGLVDPAVLGEEEFPG